MNRKPIYNVGTFTLLEDGVILKKDFNGYWGYFGPVNQLIINCETRTRAVLLADEIKYIPKLKEFWMKYREENFLESLEPLSIRELESILIGLDQDIENYTVRLPKESFTNLKVYRDMIVSKIKHRQLEEDAKEEIPEKSKFEISLEKLSFSELQEILKYLNYKLEKYTLLCPTEPFKYLEIRRDLVESKIRDLESRERRHLESLSMVSTCRPKPPVEEEKPVGLWERNEESRKETESFCGMVLGSPVEKKLKMDFILDSIPERIRLDSDYCRLLRNVTQVIFNDGIPVKILQRSYGVSLENFYDLVDQIRNKFKEAYVITIT